MKRLVLIALLLACGTTPAAGLYKWVDENGKVVYSDTPPPPSAKEFKKISGAPPPADPGAAKALGAVREKLQKGREAEAEQAKKDADEAARQAENQANCAQWRGELTALDRGTSLGARIDDQGNRVLLDEKQLTRRKADLQRWISDNCKS